MQLQKGNTPVLTVTEYNAQNGFRLYSILRASAVSSTGVEQLLTDMQQVCLWTLWTSALRHQ